MSKAIFFNIPSSGHVNPTIPIMELLSQTDIDLLYVNTADLRDKIEATGVRFAPYPDNLTHFHTFFANPPIDNFSSNALQLVRFARELLPLALHLIKQEQPDFIFHDSLAGWGKLAGRITGMPTLGFITTFILDNKTASSVIPLRTKLMFIPQLIGVLPSYLREAWTIRRTYQAMPLSLLEALMALGDENIVFTSQAFQPNGDQYHSIAHFVGPAIGKRIDDSDFPFDALCDDVPKVYISLGTIAKNNEFLRRCFTAFGDMNAQFILSAGKQTNLAQLGDIPDNFIVRNFVPQLAILERVDAFITHGGMNSVHEGLLYGVPLVVVPQQAEQAMVASQVVNTGAGIGLQMQPPFGDVTAEQLRIALETVLANDTYAQHAKQVGDGFRKAGGAPRIIELVQQFANKI